jgi:putative flippase GtrA
MLTGVLNTGFGYSVLAAGIYVGLPDWLALLISTILGLIFNFKTYSHLVFNTNDNSRIFMFIGVYGALYFLNLALITVFIGVGLNSYQAGFLALFPTVALSFFLNKMFVFRLKKN